jgi:dihydroxy-acid dehydratase
MKRISDEVKYGSTRAAHRSLFYAMGYTEDEIKRPLIGVVNAQTKLFPGTSILTRLPRR